MEITKWEYCTANARNDDNINKLGKQGWEAVGAVNGGADAGYINTLVFKRPCGKITIREVPSQEQNRSSGYER